MLPQKYTDSTTFSFEVLEKMAAAFANSKLFGIQTQDQALALMLLAHAEGMHPATAARDYNIIQGRPAKKAEAILRDFLSAGGTVEWHETTEKSAEATFSHTQGGTVRIKWDLAKAAQAGIGGKDTWKKYPAAMLRARLVSEGVRAVYPGATGGLYTPEEVVEFEPQERVVREYRKQLKKVSGLETVPERKEEAATSTAHPPEPACDTLPEGGTELEPKAESGISSIESARTSVLDLINTALATGAGTPLSICQLALGDKTRGITDIIECADIEVLRQSYKRIKNHIKSLNSGGK